MATDSIAVSKKAEATNFRQGAVVALGRLLFAVIFVMAGASHFNKQTIGYRAKLGAWLIVLFLIPVTLMMHKFWTVSDPMMAQIQMVMFMKNVSMLGGALLISQFGAGPFSLDARRSL